MKSNSLSWNSNNDLKLVVQALKLGRVILGSSDTVVGLLADTTQTGYDALTSIKQRVEKPYIVLIGSLEKITLFAQPSQQPAVKRLMENCWPGPLTLILNKNSKLPSYIGSQTAVALRIPQHDGLLQLLTQFDGLFSTSANISGKPTPSTLDEVDKRITNSIAYVIDDMHGSSQPSTILDCTQPQIKLVRAGTYDVTYLEKIAGVSISH